VGCCACGLSLRSHLAAQLGDRGVAATDDRRIGDEMSAVKIVGIVLIAAGSLGLVYGGFSYAKETHEAKIGSLELSIKDKQTVNVPVWAGVGRSWLAGSCCWYPRRTSIASARPRPASDEDLPL
jgi:hypothetical protein